MPAAPTCPATRYSTIIWASPATSLPPALSRPPLSTRRRASARWAVQSPSAMPTGHTIQAASRLAAARFRARAPAAAKPKPAMPLPSPSATAQMRPTAMRWRWDRWPLPPTIVPQRSAITAQQRAPAPPHLAIALAQPKTTRRPSARAHKRRARTPARSGRGPWRPV